MIKTNMDPTWSTKKTHPKTTNCAHVYTGILTKNDFVKYLTGLMESVQYEITLRNQSYISNCLFYVNMTYQETDKNGYAFVWFTRKEVFYMLTGKNYNGDDVLRNEVSSLNKDNKSFDIISNFALLSKRDNSTLGTSPISSVPAQKKVNKELSCTPFKIPHITNSDGTTFTPKFAQASDNRVTDDKIDGTVYCHIPHCLPTNAGQVPHCLPTNAGQVPHCLPTNAGQVPHCLPTNAGQVQHCLPTNAGQVPHCLPTNAGQVPHCLPTNAGRYTKKDLMVICSPFITSDRLLIDIVQKYNGSHIYITFDNSDDAYFFLYMRKTYKDIRTGMELNFDHCSNVSKNKVRNDHKSESYVYKTESHGYKGKFNKPNKY